MAKKKEFDSVISVSMMDKYMKEHPVENAQIAIGDMTVQVKPFVGAADFADIINTVVAGSFDEDEETGDQIYQPYFRDLLFDMKIIEKYTNIALPQNYATRYDLIRYLDHIGVMEQIKDSIDNDHFLELESCVYGAVDYAKSSGQRAAERAVVYIGNRLRALSLYAHDVIGKLDGLADVLGDEDAVVQIVQKLREVSDEGDRDGAPINNAEEDVKYEDGDRVIPIPDRK